MHAPMKYVEKGLSIAANGLWHVFNTANQIRQNPSFTPKWSDKPLLKSYEKTKPTLGWPRQTDSLCPNCVREARQEILDGKRDVSILLNEKVGEIPATILERDGKILMVKDCPIHGHFEDVMAIDTAFFKHLEEVFPGRDIRAHNDEKLHNHGSSTIQHGRGSVLTVDLTNRCNMMCDPCFMDANQVGFVHELTWEDIRMVLDNAISIKPKRQMSVQFSGGEPTCSPGGRGASAAAASRRSRRGSSTPSATRAKAATTRSRPRPTASSSRRIPNSRRRPPRRDSATPTCSSTVSATPPTRTAASATCSTSSCARSKTCT